MDFIVSICEGEETEKRTRKEERNFNLDIFWLKDEAHDDAQNLPEVEDLASDALAYLEAAADEVQEILRFLGNGVKA